MLYTIEIDSSDPMNELEKKKSLIHFYMDKKNKELEKKKIELNISKDLENIKKFSLVDLIKLGENNIKNLDNLADLSSDELIEILDTNNLKKKDADEIIMKARENWFKEDKKKN